MRALLRRAPLAASTLVVASALALAACSSGGSPSGGSSASGSGSGSGTAKKGLKVFVIPKNLGNPYFTTADSQKTGGAIAAISSLGDTGTETSGNAATSASQIPALQAAITKGANALVVSATDPTALCPTLNGAIKRKIPVVTYDSDAPGCRSLFINQASTAAIGTSEV
ncbi:MAG TPA: substrate-binding domain-containing protein, partial [Streptosporangiaceae bacterium]